jgi:hypothetical protein
MPEVTKEQIYKLLMEISADFDAMKKDLRQIKALTRTIEKAAVRRISILQRRTKTDD